MNPNQEGNKIEQQPASDTNLSSLTQEQATESNAIQIPEISLPKGGGALKGIDEKFEVNSANGTATFNMPLPITPGRNGFAPSLNLSYNSGSGNSEFGLGWSVDLPSIQRKTDKQLPRYWEEAEEDVFTLVGAEDLVPFLIQNEDGTWTPKETQVGEYVIKNYRPRVESSFARIEKITHPIRGTYWKVTNRENIATFFGIDPNTRMANPSNEKMIFKWLPAFSYDDKGNWMQYHFKKDTNFNTEPDDSIPNSLHERNRKSGLALFTNTYLERVTYGNRNAWYADSSNPYDVTLPNAAEYFFELVMDYGEYDDANPSPSDSGEWTYREDAFSSYRSGFEIRTNRLCKRILMFHHFTAETQWLGYENNGNPMVSAFGENYLIRSLNLEYEASSINDSGQAEVTYLKAISEHGFIRKEDGSYAEKSLPPMEFTYEKLNWNDQVKVVDKEHLIHAPVGLTNRYQWVDLYGEGISGILTEQGEGWFYKSNKGITAGRETIAFTPAQKVIPKPSFTGLATGTLSIQDLEANGKKQVVVSDAGRKGYFELTSEQSWTPFMAFETTVNIDVNEPNTRLIDLNGDGQADLVVTEENVFVWYPSEGKRGYAAAEFAAKTFDEESGPAILFADQQQSIFLADMSGDGLTDIVRIRNGEICYWANMGYGKFSAKVNMSNAPTFDHPESFHPKYLHLADISGTGAMDLTYLAKNECRAFINQSGNAWSNVHKIKPFFPIDSSTQFSVTDLLGTGTSCMVWSSDLPAFSEAPMRYIDLMDSKKPHVLIHYKNNFGKDTHIEYKSSTHFYLKDKQDGKPWITKLPFPVQVVHKLIIEEQITAVRFSTEYKYHHGYYDHPEREFRGFGMVEQIDSEHYAQWKKNNENNQLEKNELLYQQPMLTKTWYHTGAYLDQEKITTHFKKEYWQEIYNQRFPLAPLTIPEPELPETQLSDAIVALVGDEFREAVRACKGMALRQEIFAMDAPNDASEDQLKQQLKPYSVATHNCNIQLLQARAKNNHAVFLVTESEAINIHYERDETDYRLSHTINTEIDDLGNILESAAIVYGRNGAKAQAVFQSLTNTVSDFSNEALNGDPVQMQQMQDAFEENILATRTAQTKIQITYTQNSFAKFRNGGVNFDDINLPHVYRLRLPNETKTFEITGLAPANDIFSMAELKNILDQTNTIPYHQNPDGSLENRLIEQVRTQYLEDDLNELPFGFFGSLGLTYQNYQLAYTSGLIDEIYSQENEVALESEGNTVLDIIQTEQQYDLIDGDFWIRSGITHFKNLLGETIFEARARFFSPIAFEDPTGEITAVTYDTETFNLATRNNDGYYLFIKSTTDAIGNKTQVDHFDYRVFAPVRLIDMNANPVSVLLDELGLIKAQAAEGNGVFLDADRTVVNIVQAADNLSGLNAFSDEAEQTIIDQLFGAATNNSTNTNALNSVGNQLLRQASLRFVYDFDRFKNTGDQPTITASVSREQHFADNNNSPLQFGFEFTDGLGNLAMSKIQAEPGIAFFVENGQRIAKDTGSDLRWIANGRTVLNNKGNPVKQYEPYFSTNFLFETAPQLVEIGVTPIFHYDAPGRLIKTEFPDGTFSKVEFDSWKQLHFDQNDTVLDSTWFTNRVNNLIDAELVDQGKDPEQEKLAAQKSAAHANTPTSMYLDSLGRPVLSMTDNAKDATQKNRWYTTFVELDIEDNTKKVTDARGNTVMQYQYNMLGHRVYQKSKDGGTRWVFNNLMGNPQIRWDSRAHVFRFSYDELQRPKSVIVTGGDGAVNLNHIYERNLYGEGVADEYLQNLRGQLVRQYDTAGSNQNTHFDFKNNLLQSSRVFNADYKNVPNWTDATLLNPAFEADIYQTRNEYDALNRVVKTITPDNSITSPTFNEAGLLNQVSIVQTGIAEKLLVRNIDYDAKGQRERIVYEGNNGNHLATTNYQYDQETFRLLQLRTTKLNGGVLQDLRYTYDSFGNVLIIEDKAIPTRFFNGQRIEAKNEFTYDASYQLIRAEGREHAGQTLAFGPCDNWQDKNFMQSFSPGNDMAWRNYIQTYTYDTVGNILSTDHDATSGNSNYQWLRLYDYETENNRLIQTQLGNQTYNYTHHPEHGFIESLPHLSLMQWNFKDELQATASQRICTGVDPETTYYIYDANGQRVRKITEHQGGNKKEERLYVGNMEVYKRHSGGFNGLERTTLHVMDDTRRIAMIDTRNNVNDDTEVRTVRFQFSNHLGSATLELNDNGEVINYEEYHPFGTTAYQAVNANIRAAAKRYRYTGMERDEESGLEYHSARYYLVWLGRWLSSDPIGIEGGLNLYRYSKNSPLNHTDSSGLDPDDEPPPPEPDPDEDSPVRLAGKVPFGLLFGPQFAVIAPLLDPPSPENIRLVSVFGTSSTYTGLQLTDETTLAEAARDLPSALSWIGAIPLTIGTDVLLVPSQQRMVFGQVTEGYHIEVDSTFTFNFGPVGIGFGTETIVASGRYGDVESQTVGQFRLSLFDRFDLTYRNDHDFSFGALPFPFLGGGTDQGLTAEGVLTYRGNHFLGAGLTLTDVGIGLELNTGTPLEYGPTGEELPAYSEGQIIGSEIDNGVFDVRVGLEHQPSGVRIGVRAGVNSTAGRAGVQDYVHRNISDSPIFPQFRPRLSPSFSLSLSIPMSLN